MALVQPFEQVGIQADMAAANNGLVEASLLPFSGPTIDELQANRDRWINGERIKPFALPIGQVEFADGAQDGIAEVLKGREFDRLIGDRVFIEDLIYVLGEQTKTVALIHEQVKRVSTLDAFRRGVKTPNIKGATTLGGVHKYTMLSERPHIDNKRAPKAKIRSVFTGFGMLTGFDLDEVSLEDFGESIYLPDSRVAAINRTTPYVGRVAQIWLFENHTPHWRPDPDNKSRLFTTLDIVEGHPSATDSDD